MNPGEWLSGIRGLRESLEAVGVVLVLVGGFTAYQQWQGRVRAEALYEREAEVTDSLEKRVVAPLRDTVAAMDSAAAADSARWERERDRLRELVAEARRAGQEAERAAAAAGRTLRQSLDSLRASVRPELVPVADTALAQLERLEEARTTTVAMLRNQLELTVRISATKDSTISSLRGRLRARDRLIDRLEELNARKDDQIAYLDDRLNPNVFEWAWRNGPKLAVLVGGAILAERLVLR